MAIPPIVFATLQASVLTGISNVLAQFLSSYRQDAPFVLDLVPLFQFMLFALINTPPNFLWQQFLEETWPGYHVAPTKEAIASAAAGDEKSLDCEASEGRLVEPRLNMRNTLIKTALDQTAGAAVNTLLFLTYLHAAQLAFPPAQTASATIATVGGILLADRVLVPDLARVDAQVVWARAQADFWPLIHSGWSFWPFVSLVNFAFVPTVEARNLVGSLAGMAWTVYVSLFSAGH